MAHAREGPQSFRPPGGEAPTSLGMVMGPERKRGGGPGLPPSQPYSPFLNAGRSIRRTANYYCPLSKKGQQFLAGHKNPAAVCVGSVISHPGNPRRCAGLGRECGMTAEGLPGGTELLSGQVGITLKKLFKII